MSNKKCNVCKETKSISEFYFIKTRNNYKGHCKDCHINGVLESRRKNERKCGLEECNNNHYALGYCRLHYERFKKDGHPGSITVYNSANASDPRNLRKYGITPEEFVEMSANGCQICGIQIASFTIDHDHACCDEVPYCGECTRGYVCQSCNTSIGKYENNTINSLNPVKDKIVTYLANHEMRRQRLENIKTWHDIIVDPENKRKEW
jgi:hypothetical protein